MLAPADVASARHLVSLRAALLIAPAVVLVHALLLQHARLAAPGADSGVRTPPAALQVRTLKTATPTAAQAPPVAPVSVVAAPAPARPQRVAAHAAGSRVRQTAVAVAPPAAPLDVAPAGESAGVEAEHALAAPEPELTAKPIPTYPTTIAPPFTLLFDVRHGASIGRAELHWRPAGDAYEAQLTAILGEVRWLQWTSRGGFDAAGIAPLRFTDQRRNRSAQAANFQRSAGAETQTISYSGPAVRYPLHAGAQDRLSWIVQLPAIVQARGSAPNGGDTITMFVSGARGDADVWVFTVIGTEPHDSALGMIDALKLVREPRRPYDTRAEMWLDPARQHLPVRLRLTHAPHGDALEFVLVQQNEVVRP